MWKNVQKKERTKKWCGRRCRSEKFHCIIFKEYLFSGCNILDLISHYKRCSMNCMCIWLELKTWCDIGSGKKIGCKAANGTLNFVVESMNRVLAITRYFLALVANLLACCYTIANVSCRSHLDIEKSN